MDKRRSSCSKGKVPSTLPRLPRLGPEDNGPAPSGRSRTGGCSAGSSPGGNTVAATQGVGTHSGHISEGSEDDRKNTGAVTKGQHPQRLPIDRATPYNAGANNARPSMPTHSKQEVWHQPESSGQANRTPRGHKVRKCMGREDPQTYGAQREHLQLNTCTHAPPSPPPARGPAPIPVSATRPRVRENKNTEPRELRGALLHRQT